MVWLRRTRTPDSQVSRATTLVASAARLRYDAAGTLRRMSTAEWQREAWEHYDDCGELRYVVTRTANALSRARLYVTELDETGRPAEQPPDTVRSNPAALFGGPAGQSELLRTAGRHLLVPGECYLVGESVNGGEQWQVASTEELSERGGRYWLDQGNGGRELDPATTVIIRLWNPHPRRRWEADSQVRACRRPLRTLSRLAQHTQAQIDSRLAGAGLLLLPNELSFAAASAEEAAVDSDGTGGADSLLAALSEAMLTAIRDRDSVAAVVPIVLQGPGEHLDKARLLTLDSPLSEAASGLEDAAIRRLALGLDVQPEMLLGLGQANHWSAWQLEESEIKLHLEPLLELICAALTEQFLWPALTDEVDDPRRWVVWYDTTELTQRPDKSALAQAAFDRGELAGTALRRECGFGDDDAPTPNERELRQLLDVVRVVPTAGPALLPQILASLGVREVVSAELVDPGRTPAPVVRSPTVPVLAPPVGDRDLPERSAAAGPHLSGEFVAACEVLVHRALEVAGKRLVGRDRHKLGGLAAWEYHTAPGYTVTPTSVPRLLVDGFTGLPVLAARVGMDPHRLEAVLSAYVGDRLTGAARHNPEALRRHLTTALCGPGVG